MDKQTHGPLQTLSKKSRTYTQKMFIVITGYPYVFLKMLSLDYYDLHTGILPYHSTSK